MTFDYLKDTTSFELEAGSIRNLRELADALEGQSESTYLKYNNMHKNDFYSWIKNSVGDQRLARDIMKIRHKDNLLKILRNRISHLKDYMRHPEHAKIVRRIEMYVDHVEFAIDKEICSNCEICTLVCPVDAVEVKDNITVNETCTKCGFCVMFCPIDAMSWTNNGKENEFFRENNMVPGFPDFNLVNDVKSRKFFEGTYEIVKNCPAGCEECVAACPINIITRVKERELSRISVEHDKCLMCGACKNACPHDLIVTKRNVIKYQGEEYCNSWNRAIEKLTGTQKKHLYHNQKNLSKIRGLVEKHGLKKY